jgi:isopentenyl phosphate kinase
MKQIVFVKLGGSLITDKTKPFTVDNKTLDTVIKEIKKVFKKNIRLVIGHGGGSFPHTLAKQYNTINGIKNSESVWGACLVEQAAVKLNSIVLERLLKVGLPAINLSPLASFIMKNKKVCDVSIQALEKALDLGMLPIVYGDLVLDKKIGFTICSTEKVLSAIALNLNKNKFKAYSVIHCTRTNGIYDNKGNTIPVINKNNFAKIKSSLTGSVGIDVTGGMIHKVEESLTLAKKGINSLVLNGQIPENLSKAILGKPVIATRIEK